jgi:flagellar basal body-associated protein FliL
MGLIFLVIGSIAGFSWLGRAAETKKNIIPYQRPPILERTLKLSPVVVNLLGDGETVLEHYLRIQVQLVFRDQKTLNYGKEMRPFIEEAIVSHSGKLSYMQAFLPYSRDHFKIDLKKHLNHDLGGDFVDEVLITEYIVE